VRKGEIEIVVIEDEEDILELIEYHLSTEGYAVTGFRSTENVKRFIEEESPALLIVDRNLPGVEGSEFVREIRNEGYSTPVIFLTAKDKMLDVERGFWSGGDDYITKPFKFRELLLRVKALLRRSGVIQMEQLSPTSSPQPSKSLKKPTIALSKPPFYGYPSLKYPMWYPN
jgi:DNA-binding response OmpR family regulator